MTWLWITGGIVAGLVGLVILMVVIGYCLPKGHVARRQATFRQPPSAIWETITNYDALATWRPDVKKVERLPNRDGSPCWREFWGGDAITFVQAETNRPTRLVVRIADDKLPFGGRWEYNLTGTADGGTLLTISEIGEVYNPVFRFISFFFLGHHGSLEKYLKALGRKFGEDVTPAPVPEGQAASAGV